MEKKNEQMLLIVIAFAVGVLVGVIGAKVTQETPSQSPTAPAVAPPAAPQVNYQQQIQQLKQIVASDPENRNAWARLGHAYFDSNQPAKAIEAYDKALALNPNDADLLTDQGVMFRRMGWYDKAIENFSKANEVNPSHAVSLFNLGIVYRYDLQEFDKAIEAWEKYLQVNPTGQQAEQVKAELEFLKSHPEVPKGQ
ncbi:MAG: tetratricopeptide repeat protein [Desulfuromonadales bacterium]|nr:tetratricopeptide repeat protein [Desulfuromonadales bacterium]NIR34039.1 tetratricopeptide repeat protein [Desulfuromonadales bacterium]NIS44090.1 tetratricopeptide repeat protein [Desulfuromonadales bacterium]